MTDDFRIAEFIVRPMRDCVENDGRRVHVKPKAMAVLARLADAGGQVVTRNQLFEAVWPGAEVSDDVLTQCIYHAHDVPSERERSARGLRMNSFSHEEVSVRHPGRQHPNTHLTTFRLGEAAVNDLENLGAAAAGGDDAPVDRFSH